MQKVWSLIKKHWDIVSYLFFGVLTTLVDFLIYFPCFNLLGMSALSSNALAWVAAVIFAFVTNKPFVFGSHDWSRKTVIPEAMKFIGSRLGSFLVQELILFVTVDWIGCNGNVMKLLVSVLVIILNYVASKLLVFRK